MENSNSRIVWLDFCRVFAMFIIVLSHTPVSLKFIIPFTYIYLTTFFVCSGMMFDINKYSSFLEFIKEKAVSLIIPFLSFHFISYFFWLFFDRNFGADVDKAYSWYEPLPDIFLGKFAIDDAPLWFLTALFSVEIIYYVLYKLLGNNRMKYILPLLLIIGYLVQKFIDVKLPMMLHSAAVAIFFYSVGNLYKNEIKKYSRLNVYWHVVFAIIGAIIVCFISIPNGKIAMHTNQYGDFWIFILLSLLAMLTLESFCVVLEKCVKHVNIIEYISRNLIVVVGLHMIVGKFLKAFTVFVLNKPLDIYIDKVCINLIFSFLSIVLLLPVMWFLNKYTPRLIGKRK